MPDEDIKKFGNIVKETLRPLKELVELLKSKVDQQDFYLKTTNQGVRSIKEQQSVINEKLDEVQQTVNIHTQKLDILWDQTERLTFGIEDIKDTLKSQSRDINQTNDNVKKVNKRLTEAENNLGIAPPPELTINN